MIAYDQRFHCGGRDVYVDMPDVEAIERFPCFGGPCGVMVTGHGGGTTARGAALWAKCRLLVWHDQFSRFDPESELSRLNRDPRGTVPVSQAMARFVRAAIDVARWTRGLVDPTLVPEIERAGYQRHFDAEPLTPVDALALAPPRAPAQSSRDARWARVRVDADHLTVARPPDVQLDSGGLAKGLFGDMLARGLSEHDAFAVDAAGDLRLGGSAGLTRPVEVRSPFDADVLHTFELVEGAAATSGIDKRSWLRADGRPAHHLLDPATGMPAFTGIVQATALAPTALEAEARSKAALLSGAAAACQWLSHGGLLVFDDGHFEVLDPTGSDADRWM